MATCSYLLNHAHFKGWSSKIRISNHRSSTITERLRCPRRQKLVISQCSVGVFPIISGDSFDHQQVSEILRLIEMPETSPTAVSTFVHQLVVADLDPATLFSFLFIAKIVMSWYPKIPVGKFPYVLAYAPTESILIPTRKVIPPLGGVDVTPVVWFGLISFLNEILIGPQGLLVLLSQQVS